jgi:hypothetical protein
MKKEIKTPPTYYVIIPAEVRFSKQVSAPAKILYGEILALSALHGFCSASNDYWANLFNVDDKTVSLWVSQLNTANFIKNHWLKSGERKIYPKIAHLKEKTLPSQDSTGGQSGKDLGSQSGKADNNNTSINNINNNSEEVQKPLAEVFNSEQYFKGLVKSSNVPLSIIGYYTLKKENHLNISSKEQASAVIARNIKVAKRLAVFEKAKISRAIDDCQNTIIGGRPMNYSLETVEKFILK